MIRTASWRDVVRLPFAALLCLALLLPALPAFTAESAADEEEAAEEEEVLTEVQVTGTRIQNPNVTSANPITSITGDEMRQLGFVNVADAMLMLVPQNISTYQPGLVGDIQSSSSGELGFIGGQGNNDVDRGSLFLGATIANLRGMDPMFGTRTLTLIDGRRTVSSSSQADIVDMNIIPSNLLQRMDVVTGGASATYGSGAMAGVVNLVLNNRKQGYDIQLDYGFNEAGDGASPHVSITGGTRIGSRAHILFGAEWQEQSAIRDCAEARSWCAESRTMFTNSQSSLIESNYNSPIEPLSGFENMPARFQMAGMRFNQFSSNGVIYEAHSSLDPNVPAPTVGYRFTADGRGIEEFPYGYRGARNLSSVMNGDGPLTTTGTTLRPQQKRTNLFTNFEFDFTERTTGYFQASYAMTDANNNTRYTTSTVCARFDAPGIPAVAGSSVNKGQVVQFGSIGETHNVDGVPTPKTPDPAWDNEVFREFVGAATTSGGSDAATNTPSSGGFTRRGAPYMISPTGGSPFGSTTTTPPTTYQFSANVAEAHWRRVNTASGSLYWNLDYIVISSTAGDPGSEVAFFDPGLPPVLPPVGNNSYAFLNMLSPEALNQVQNAFNRNPNAGSGNASTAALWTATPCAGYTAIRKVWNPQIRQYSTSDGDTWRAVAGMRGRFGRDWRWDAYYQHGKTENTSKQFNGFTNLSMGFAMDAVIDDRLTRVVNGQTVSNLPADGGTYGRPVCRVARDGIPTLDTNGIPMSDSAGLMALAEGCKPLNVFGDYTVGPTPWEGLDMSSAELAQLQRDAIDYAFRDSISEGATDRQTLSFTTNGTLWDGWGAGPLTGAFGVELSQDSVDNSGTRGSSYLRADVTSWNDAFGGKTRSTEGYAEFNMPLLSGLEGINLWSINAAGRYTSYYNKGGAGTTGESATQGTFNWKMATVFEPFDFVRLRLTRSRDLRAATYRDLFLNQPTLPDQSTGRNLWRERTVESDINQVERWGTVRVGNPDLKPERSDTLTLGLVLSPGAWAQGMRFSADYYDIRVKGGIYTPYAFTSANSIIENCFLASGNSNDPDHPNFGLFLPPNMNDSSCREITFHQNSDGSTDPRDIIYVNATRPQNGLPYQRRGVDVSMNYTFPLNRAFERVPGALSLTVRGARALEASGLQQTVSQRVNSQGEVVCNTGFTQVTPGIFVCNEELRRIDMVGQIRSSQFIPGISASPKWTGSFIAGYSTGRISTSLTARYIGGARMDNTWCDEEQFERGSCTNYIDEQGRYLGGSVDDNWVKPYVNFSWSGNYKLELGNLRQSEVFWSVSNLFDKSPPFTGGGISGASAGYHDTYGRAYRMGVRLGF